MTDLRKAAEQALEALEGLSRDADEDCGEPRCGDCKPLRPARAAITALRAALAEPPAKPEPVHPGYVIGSHFLETAYSRIAAGEDEAEVLAEVLGERGWVRPDAIAQAVEAEREACAEICERRRSLYWMEFDKSGKEADRTAAIASEECADAIRARGSK